MLTADAQRYYGIPHLVCPVEDVSELRKALKLIERQVKPKANERYVVAVFRRRDSVTRDMEEARGET